jgi:hypothetical protein
MAAFVASQGCIVVARELRRQASSTLPIHPYLIADQQ